MTYAVSNPPFLMLPRFNDSSLAIWGYKSTDDAATVDGNGYFTNAKALGMRVGDQVNVIDTDASPVTGSIHFVCAINANGSADLSNAAATGGTNSD